MKAFVLLIALVLAGEAHGECRIEPLQGDIEVSQSGQSIPYAVFQYALSCEAPTQAELSLEFLEDGAKDITYFVLLNGRGSEEKQEVSLNSAPTIVSVRYDFTNKKRLAVDTYRMRFQLTLTAK